MTLAKRIEELQGKFGANRRRDDLIGTEVWFAIPYNETRSYSMLASLDHVQQPAISERATNSASDIPITKSHSQVPSVLPQLTYSDIANKSKHEPKHILIVDDSAAIVKMLSMMLKKLGYIVSTAMHGKAAVDIVADSLLKERQQYSLDSSNDTSEKQTKARIDIILMDIRMPVMNGFEAMKGIRQLEQFHRIAMSKFTGSQSIHTVASEDVDQQAIIVHKLKELSSICIVAMSANSEFSTYQDAVNAGADGFLNKPFTMELFERTLEKFQRKGSN